MHEDPDVGGPAPPPEAPPAELSPGDLWRVSRQVLGSRPGPKGSTWKTVSSGTGSLGPEGWISAFLRDATRPGDRPPSEVDDAAAECSPTLEYAAVLAALVDECSAKTRGDLSAPTRVEGETCSHWLLPEGAGRTADGSLVELLVGPSVAAASHAIILFPSEPGREPSPQTRHWLDFWHKHSIEPSAMWARVKARCAHGVAEFDDAAEGDGSLPLPSGVHRLFVVLPWMANSARQVKGSAGNSAAFELCLQALEGVLSTWLTTSKGRRVSIAVSEPECRAEGWNPCYPLTQWRQAFARGSADYARIDRWSWIADPGSRPNREFWRQSVMEDAAEARGPALDQQTQGLGEVDRMLVARALDVRTRLPPNPWNAEAAKDTLQQARAGDAAASGRWRLSRALAYAHTRAQIARGVVEVDVEGRSISVPLRPPAPHGHVAAETRVPMREPRPLAKWSWEPSSAM